MSNLIDAYLDDYAANNINSEGTPYLWWWNGCDVLADAIASLAHHVREDGCHLLEDAEIDQLKTLEKYMAAYPEFDNLTTENQAWLHAEAMWLLTHWFNRLWD